MTTPKPWKDAPEPHNHISHTSGATQEFDIRVDADNELRLAVETPSRYVTTYLTRDDALSITRALINALPYLRPTDPDRDTP